MKGTKHDGGKPMMSLIDPLFLTHLAQVLTFGANKYEPNNWRGGITTSRLLDAALRHVNAFNAGEDTDPESGLSHMAHAACCLMFIDNLIVTKPETDDRWKTNS